MGTPSTHICIYTVITENNLKIAKLINVYSHKKKRPESSSSSRIAYRYTFSKAQTTANDDEDNSKNNDDDGNNKNSREGEAGRENGGDCCATRFHSILTIR